MIVRLHELRAALKPVIEKVKVEEHGFGLTLLDASDVDPKDFEKLKLVYERLDKE